jgi:hypothetical protein
MQSVTEAIDVLDKEIHEPSFKQSTMKATSGNLKVLFHSLSLHNTGEIPGGGPRADKGRWTDRWEVTNVRVVDAEAEIPAHPRFEYVGEFLEAVLEGRGEARRPRAGHGAEEDKDQHR